MNKENFDNEYYESFEWFWDKEKEKEKEMGEMNKDDYIIQLEILLEDLLGEIESLSDDYGFNIHGGDCNYNYIKNEYKLLKEKEIK